MEFHAVMTKPEDMSENFKSFQMCYIAGNEWINVEENMNEFVEQLVGHPKQKMARAIFMFVKYFHLIALLFQFFILLNFYTLHYFFHLNFILYICISVLYL